MASIPLLRLSLPKPQSLRPQITLHPPLQFRPIPTTARCSYTPTPATDRLISAASYFIPFFNGMFLFDKYPLVYEPLKPLFHPLLLFYYSVPNATSVTFLGLHLCVVKNPSFSRYARSHALQALVVDLLRRIIYFGLLWGIVSLGQIRIELKLQLIAWGCSGVFWFVAACFVYGLVSSVLGNTPYFYV